MRQFSDWEKELLNKIALIKPSRQVAIDKWLEQNFFREADGRALIIQAKSRFAVFFLRPDVFEDAKKKEQEMVKFLEVVSLITFLKDKGYITLFRGQANKRKEMFFVQDKFINPLPKGENIILNSRGDYTSGPDTIHDKDQQIVYKGEYIDMEPFEQILDATTGTLYVSAGISELQEAIKKPNAQVPPRVVTPVSTPQEQSHEAPAPENTHPTAAPLPQKKLETTVVETGTKSHEMPAPKYPPPKVSVTNSPKAVTSPSSQVSATPEVKKSSPPPTASRQSAKGDKGKLLLMVLGAAILVVLLVVGGWAFWKMREYDKQLSAFNSKQSSEDKELNGVFNELGKMERRLDGLASSRSAGEHRPGAPEQPGVYYGIDVSNWNGDIVSDIDQLDSLSFVICKATEGLHFVDREFKYNWTTIKRKGLIRGAYHFFHVDEDPVEQATFYTTEVGTLSSTDMAPIVDIEKASLPFRSQVNKETLQQNLLLFLRQIETKFHRKPIIYTNLAFANRYLKLKIFAQYPLWLAEYTNGTKPIVPNVWREKGCKIWQKSASYDLHSKHVDFDIFYGRKEALYSDEKRSSPH